MPDYAKYRKAARSAGRRAGFYARKRELHDAKNKRYQELVKETGIQERTAAREQFKTMRAAAVAENQEIAAQQSAGFFKDNTDGKLEYSDLFFQTKAMEQANKAKGVTFDSLEQFLNSTGSEAMVKTMKSRHGKFRNRVYKSEAEMSASLERILQESRNKQLSNQNKRQYTELDRLLSFGLNKSEEMDTSAVGTVEGMRDPSTFDLSKHEAFDEKLEVPKGASRKTYVTEREEMKGTWYLDGEPLHDVFANVQYEVIDGKRTGSKITEYGTMEIGADDTPVFVPVPGLTETEPEKVEEEKYKGVYRSPETVKEATTANKVLSQVTEVQRITSAAISKYGATDYGSNKWYHTFEDSVFAMTTAFRPWGEQTSVGLKKAVLENIKTSNLLAEYPEEIQTAIEKAGVEGSKESYVELGNLLNEYSITRMEEIKGTLRHVQELSHLTDDQRESIQRINTMTFDVSMQPLVRALLRTWTNGENKVAWGAAEKLLEQIKGGATTSEVVAALDFYQKSTRVTGFDNLRTKFEASMFSYGQDRTRGFIPKDYTVTREDGKTVVFQAREFRMNPKTKEMVLVVTGVQKGHGSRPVQYYIPSRGKAVYEAFLPVPSKGIVGDPDMLEYMDSYFADYTVVLNENTGEASPL